MQTHDGHQPDYLDLMCARQRFDAALRYWKRWHSFGSRLRLRQAIRTLRRCGSAAILAVALVTGSCHGPALADSRDLRTFNVPNMDLNIRSGPGVDNNLVAIIPQGSNVVVGSCVRPTDSKADWCEVWWSGNHGWSSRSQMLEVVPNPEAATPAQDTAVEPTAGKSQDQRNREWRALLGNMIRLSAQQNGGTPRYARVCQPKVGVCVRTLFATVNGIQGMMRTVNNAVTDDIMQRDVCTFNAEGDVRDCKNFDTGERLREGFDATTREWDSLPANEQPE